MPHRFVSEEAREQAAKRGIGPGLAWGIPKTPWRMSKRFASRTGWGGGGAGAAWGVKSRSLGGGRRKVSMAVPRTQFRSGPAGRGYFSGGRSAALTKNSGELKGMDTTLTIAGPIIATTNTNADAQTVNLVEPGNGSYNRIGRKIFCKTLRISGTATYQYNADPTSGSATASALRMVVVWDKQPSGTLPTYDVIFGRTSQDGTESSSVLDNLRYDNTARFQVVRDTKFLINPAAGDGGGTTNIYTARVLIDEFIDLKNRTSVFSGDSDPVTIADISSGACYIFWRSELSVDSVTDWSVSARTVARLRFTS